MAEKISRVSFLHSLRVKSAMTYLALIAVVVVMLNTYPVIVSQNLMYQSKHASLQGQAAVIASALSGPETLTPESVDRTINVLGPPGARRAISSSPDQSASIQTRVMVTDPSGLLLYDSQDGSKMNTDRQYAMIWEIVSALQGNDVFRSTYKEGAFRSRAAVPVTYRGAKMGAVYLYEYDSEQGALLLGIQHNLRSMSVVLCAGAVVLGAVFSRALTRRIGILMEGIRQVREGEYSHRVHVTGRDEMSVLGQEFNALTDRLQTTEEVRRRFVADASHELKTPLASIRLLTDSILQAKHIDEETAREFLGDIGQEAERLTRITEKLLTLTRMDNAVPVQEVVVDPVWVVEKVRHMLTPLAEKAQITLKTELQPECLLLGTEDDLYQIVFNLMENAIKYNLPGGTVLVTVGIQGTDRVVIRVEDTGVGIPDEDRQKIFDRFYRVDKARSRAAGGTGLGLSIVHDTVIEHGGTVSVSRREPQGTCFEVIFPLYSDEERKS